MMTREEAIARIKDHMSVHKMHEERAVKITEALNMAISALEQPEIIRCKDCRYMIKGQDVYTKDYFYNCNYWQADTVPDGFCHEAEKEGESE